MATEQGTTKDQLRIAELEAECNRWADLSNQRDAREHLLRKHLKRAMRQHGHEYNCSAARGSERDCTCGWTDAKAFAEKLK